MTVRTYVTEQRDLLLAYLRGHVHEQLTIDAIIAGLDGAGISRSAVYRNIDRLVDEGTVQRVATEKSRSFLYRYTGNAECSTHLHLKCTECGRVYHLDEDGTEAILAAVLRNQKFRVDGKRTTLLGVCRECVHGTKEVPLTGHRHETSGGGCHTDTSHNH